MRSFLAGTAAMATNLTIFALYIPALALIAGSDLPLGQQGIAALIILLITLVVAWVPSCWPRRSRPRRTACCPRSAAG